MLTALATALDAGDPPNPWPGGIPDPMWWLVCRCLELEPGTINAGVYADKPGFHNTVAHNQAKWPDNYSINPSIPALLNGPHDKARAFDWQFPEAQKSPPDYRRINLYSGRLLEASKARDPRLRGWYEWFGTHDGTNIGYGIYKNRPSSSDDSHDWHIHSSELTQFVLSWPAAHGYLSVLMGETLKAFLARGGQVIEEATDMTTLDDEFKNADGVKRSLKQMIIDLFDQTFCSPYTPAFPDSVSAKVESLSKQLAGLEQIQLNDAQVSLIGTAAGRKVLETLAGAEEVSAKVLREGSGQ
jgi:hypothetical protein